MSFDRVFQSVGIRQGSRITRHSLTGSTVAYPQNSVQLVGLSLRIPHSACSSSARRWGCRRLSSPLHSSHLLPDASQWHTTRKWKLKFGKSRIRGAGNKLGTGHMRYCRWRVITSPIALSWAASRSRFDPADWLDRLKGGKWRQKRRNI